MCHVPCAICHAVSAVAMPSGDCALKSAGLSDLIAWHAILMLKATGSDGHDS